MFGQENERVESDVGTKGRQQGIMGSESKGPSGLEGVGEAMTPSVLSVRVGGKGEGGGLFAPRRGGKLLSEGGIENLPNRLYDMVYVVLASRRGRACRSVRRWTNMDKP